MTDQGDLRAIVEAAASHVAFDGWTRRALEAGAYDCNIDPEELDNLFPGGAESLVRAFSAEMDHRMLAELEKTDLEAMRVRDRVATAVRLRLEVMEPYREAVRRGLAYFAFPTHAAAGLGCLYRTVDAVWYAAGDRATDYNFYTKRMLLAGVYSSTVLCWLDDKSEGHERTWAFLDRRIDEVLKIGGTFGKTFGRVLSLPDRLLAKRPRRTRRAAR